MFSESRSIFAMTASRFPFHFAIGKVREQQDAQDFYPRCSLHMCAITILHWRFQIRAAIAAANGTGDESTRRIGSDRTTGTAGTRARGNRVTRRELQGDAG